DPLRLAVDDPALLRGAEIAPWLVERNAALLRILDQVVLALLEARRLPWLDRAAAQRLRFVGNHQPVVDADHAAEAAADVAGTHRRIERERALVRLAIVDVAIGAMQVAAEPPGRGDR